MQAAADVHTGAQIRIPVGGPGSLLFWQNSARAQDGDQLDALPPRWVFLKPTFCGISLGNVNTVLSMEV